MDALASSSGKRRGVGVEERCGRLGQIAGKDPIAQSLSGSFISGGSAGDPVLCPNDPGGIVFGELVLEGKPSHAVKHTDRGTTVLLPPEQYFGGLTFQLIHSIAVLAGIETMGSPGQVT